MSTAPQRYVLKPRPPIRALVIAAVLVLAGALLLAVSSHGDGSTLGAALSALVLALGLALAVGALRLMRRMRSIVEFDDEGYRITGAGAGAGGSGRWADITRATTQSGGSHLVLHHRDESRTHLICPLGGDDEQMQRLVADVARRLDASRGYGETMHVPLINPHQPADPDVVS